MDCFVDSFTVIDNINDLRLNDDVEVCRCLGVTIKDVKKLILPLNKKINFVEFQQILDCGDVCEQCLTKESNNKRVKITLEELFIKKDV